MSWDLDGDPIKYRIDWGDGRLQETFPGSGGLMVTATHSWTTAGTYNVKVQAIQIVSGIEKGSAWSPTYGFNVTTGSGAKLEGFLLIGPSGNAASSASKRVTMTIGEPVVTPMSSANYGISLRYQGANTSLSSSTPLTLGAAGPGGQETLPPGRLSMTATLALTGWSTEEVTQIAKSLRQNALAQLRDANGNYRVSNGKWIKFDSNNRPVRIVTSDGTKTEMVYAYDGTRVKKTVTPPSGPAVTTLYIGDIYEQTGGQGTAHIFAGGQRIASKTGDAVLYFHQDHLGSTSLVTDMAGAVVQTTRYMPFGNIYSSNGSLTDVGFTGHRHDFSDGLIYMKARYYDPAIGRFVSPDTLVQSPYDPQTLNRYAYGRNNPVLYTDPSGHSFSLNRTINAVGKELKRINQTMYRQWHRWDDQLSRLQEKNPNFNFSGGYGITLGGNDRDSFTGDIRYHPYNKPCRPEPNNPVSTLLVDVAKEISNNAYSRPGAGLLAEAGVGDYHSKAEEWALRVAEWSEATSYVANGVAIGSLLFGPEAAPVYGGASLVAAGLDITATAGYWTHYSLSNQKASLFKGFSSFLSVPLDAVPMFKPGISVTRIGGAVSYMERFGSRSGFISKWYGTLRIAGSDVTKISIQETAGYLGDHNSGEKRK